MNINAPRADGTRPDPTAGTITDIQSTAASAFDALNVGFNMSNPDRRIFFAMNYQLSRTINETDSPFSLAADAYNLAAERGPALFDARHRLMGFTNFPLFNRRLTMGWSYRVQSALPYNITSGRDDNNDTISNDRPAGVTRNSARGSTTVDISTRLAWKIGFGTAPSPTQAGPQVRIVRGGGDSNEECEKEKLRHDGFVSDGKCRGLTTKTHCGHSPFVNCAIPIPNRLPHAMGRQGGRSRRVLLR